MEGGDIESGAYNDTIIPVNMTTGLPEKPVVEPFPDLLIVDASLPTPGGTATCVMYVLAWHMTYPPGNNPYGGNSYEDAPNGQYLGSVEKVPTWLSCPPASVGLAAFAYE